MPSLFTAADQVGYEWLRVDLEKDPIPFRAVVGGTENGKPTYVARVVHHGHHEVAKLNHWKRFGYGFYGKELETPHGEVLVASEMQGPVWMTSAFGEHVNMAISIFADEGHQFVGRAWYKDRWIPGKVISRTGRIYFPYGGKELQSRTYQLLLGSLSWRLVGSKLPRWLVPLDAMLPGCIENSIQHAPTHLQGDKPESARLNGANHRLVQSTLDECQWVASGDGIEVRNAVMVHRYQIGRTFIPQENKYVCGWVTPVGLPRPGLHVDHAHFDTYEVLTANCKRTRASSVQLNCSADEREGQLTSPNEIFLVTKVARGESADQACHEMLEDWKACQVVESLKKEETKEQMEESIQSRELEENGGDRQKGEGSGLE